ncbi:ATP-binding protein involved in chromosome partitioning [Bacilli bacterium PM5-3]|nr:ATP-binding protein involved in chromosome partitioning [Bacilli bacterium PM5-3]MDH6604036.1 ATP-binding protein involved in chromosome partitioning [Bacilli bacterium PM5-9]
MIEKIKKFTYLNRPLEEIFKKIEVNEKDGKIYVVLGYDNEDFDEKEIKKGLMKYLKIDLKIPGAKITFKDLVAQELYDNSILGKDNILYLLISSGKGGVGKSNVSANLANAFNEKGYKVALIDCDIYGSSIPNIFKVTNYPPIVDNVLYPANVNGIDIVSVDFLMRASLPILWRGPMLNRALNHFFYFTRYQEGTQVVIIDLPPGTGDVALDMAQFMPQAYQVVVTTPHPDAASIAIKAGEMAKTMNHQLLGVIENMSYYMYEGKKLEIFGFGGADMVANTLDIPLLAKFEIETPNSGSIYQEGENNYTKYLSLVDKLIEESGYNGKTSSNK